VFGDRSGDRSDAKYLIQSAINTSQLTRFVCCFHFRFHADSILRRQIDVQTRANSCIDRMRHGENHENHAVINRTEGNTPVNIRESTV